MSTVYRWLIIGIIVLMSPNVHAEADGPDHWEVFGVAADDVLNIRQEPSGKSAKVGEIPPDGNCVKNIRCIGGLSFEEFTTLSEEEKNKIKKERPRWCLIEYQGVTGWVAGRFLREGFCRQ